MTHAHQLLDNEWGLSVASIQLANDSNTYYCIGTAMVYPEESESSQGRIILFQLLEGLTDQVASIDILKNKARNISVFVQNRLMFYGIIHLVCLHDFPKN